MKWLLFLILAFGVLGCADAEVKDGPEGTAKGHEVEQALLTKKAEFRLCHEKFATQKSGKVRVSFVIEKDGKSRQASIVENSLGVPKTEACVLDVIKTIQFPIPINGTRLQVVYPFRFDPVQLKQSKTTD